MLVPSASAIGGMWSAGGSGEVLAHHYHLQMLSSSYSQGHFVAHALVPCPHSCEHHEKKCLYASP